MDQNMLYHLQKLHNVKPSKEISATRIKKVKKGRAVNFQKQRREGFEGLDKFRSNFSALEAVDVVKSERNQDKSSVINIRPYRSHQKNFGDDFNNISDKISEFLKNIEHRHHKAQLIEQTLVIIDQSRPNKTWGQRSILGTISTPPLMASVKKVNISSSKIKKALSPVRNSRAKLKPITTKLPCVMNVTSRLRQDRKNYQPPKIRTRTTSLSRENLFAEKCKQNTEVISNEEDKQKGYSKEGWLFDQAIRGSARLVGMTPNFKNKEYTQQFDKASSKDSAYGYSGGESRIQTREPTPITLCMGKQRLSRSRRFFSCNVNDSYKADNEPEPVDLLDNKKAAYIEFLHSVTNDILTRGVYSDKILQKILNEHLKNYKELPPKERERLLNALKAEFGINKEETKSTISIKEILRPFVAPRQVQVVPAKNEIEMILSDAGLSDNSVREVCEIMFKKTDDDVNSLNLSNINISSCNSNFQTQSQNPRFTSDKSSGSLNESHSELSIDEVVKSYKSSKQNNSSIVQKQTKSLSTQNDSCTEGSIVGQDSAHETISELKKDLSADGVDSDIITDEETEDNNYSYSSDEEETENNTDE